MLKKTILKVLVKNVDKKIPLVNAYNDKCFWVYQGPVLSNLRDLLRALKYMTDAQFTHHVNKMRNDFSLWIEEVLCDSECAKAIAKADTPRKAARIVEARLKDYAL